MQILTSGTPGNLKGVEIPKSKSQIPNKSQSPNDQNPNKCVWVIRDWNLDIVWDLVLGDWCFAVWLT